MIKFSRLNKTWLLDVDGTLVKHNGYLTGREELLPGTVDFFQKIPESDKIILLTSREAEFKDELIKFLFRHNLRFDHIICDLPPGERILINDSKTSGLKTAYAFNKQRNAPLDFVWEIDENI